MVEPHSPLLHTLHSFYSTTRQRQALAVAHLNIPSSPPSLSLALQHCVPSHSCFSVITLLEQSCLMASASSNCLFHIILVAVFSLSFNSLFRFHILYKCQPYCTLFQWLVFAPHLLIHFACFCYFPHPLETLTCCIICCLQESRCVLSAHRCISSTLNTARDILGSQ